MDGFAEGLLAGFSTVDNAMQHRKELGLREAALAQQQKNSDRNFQLAQDEFGYRKETGDRDYQHTIDREKVGDEHWGKEFGLRQAETGARIGMERQRLGMQKEEHDFTMNNAKYQQTMQQWEPHTRIIENLIAQGKVQEAREYAKNNNMPLTIPVVKMLNDTGYTQSILSGGQKLHSIMSSPDAHKDPMATLNAINDNRDEIAPLLQTEADRAIGQVDPKTGQKIVAAKFNHIAPVPDKNDPKHHSPDEVAVFIKVKYANGKEAIKPITENRSANPKDPVLRANIYGLLDSSSSRVVGAHKIMNSPQSGNYDDAITSAYQPQGLSLAEQQKIAGNTASSAARAGNDPGLAYNSVMGDAFGHKENQQKAQQTQAINTAKTWVNNDPSKLEFAQGALAQMPELFEPGNEKQLEIYFQNYLKTKTEQGKTQSADVNAEGLRKRRQQQQQGDFLYGSD